MMPYISAEWRKTKKIQLLLVGALFLTLTSFIGLTTYFMYHATFVPGTESRVLWGQLTFYYSYLLYPPLLAIWVGLSLLPEFERGTIELLRANHISIPRLLFGKMVILLTLLLPLQSLLVLVYLIVAGLQGELDQLSILHLIKWSLLSILTSLPILLIQSYLMARTRNIIQSVALGTFGSIGNFIVIFIGGTFKYVYPYMLPALALRSREIGNLERLDYSSAEILSLLVATGLFSLLFFVLTCRQLEKTK